MNVISVLVMGLLVVATLACWLVRHNWILFLISILLAPLPAVIVMVVWAERFPGDAADLNYLRVAVVVPVCYAIVWMSLLAGWLSERVLTD